MRPLSIRLAAAFLFIATACRAQDAAKRYLVAFRPDAPASVRSESLRPFGRVVDAIDELGLSVVEADAGRVSALADLPQANPWVASVEEDVDRNWLASVELPSLEQVQQVLPKFAPAMAWLPKSLPAGVDAAEVPWGIARVNAPAAWAVTQGQGVKVGVIDTGIDANHPDLRVNVAGGYNAVDPKKPWFDDNDHGTHVSGTIAAAWDGKGVVGVAPKASLYAIKVLDADGSGRISAIIKGLIWAAQNHMQVVNMSLGAPMGSLFMRLAVQYAHAKGVTIIAAAGNSGGSVGYPAGYADAIAVSASDAQDHIASFSSRGNKVEFIAPGVDVKSSIPGGGYDTYSGTSMATPHVTGLAALAIARGASNPDQVRAALRRAAKSIGLSRSEQGHGLVDAAVLVR